MRLSLSFSGFGPLPPTLRAAAAAEGAGLDGVWMCEHLGFTDAVVPAAAVLARTERIEVGLVGPAPIARHPALLAMELASLAALAPGRVRVQVGLGDARLAGMLGGDHRRGVRVAGEYVNALRQLLDSEQVDGEFAGHRFAGCAIVAPPAQPAIDLLAVRPRMLELAGQVADGVSLTAGASLGYLAGAVNAVVKTLAEAGRDRSDFRISATVLGAIGDDEESAAAMLRPILRTFDAAGYAVTAPGLFDPAALAEAETGRLPMADLLTTAALSELALVATPDTLPRALARLAATGVDEVALGLVNPPEQVPGLLESLGQARP
ncbi:LLM class flavin-dependent oxidoreductase [Nonomuraea endophytica]|uniref:Alkanesulfonate monooxygenase SsuD/methylene tetrahydromethanopterin reductase-like flavin-dependent oxidoreductase (Luciferase family) n=1 Tax=Nonomuraea endophytica TaxID=714136 RepID=A0A7W8A6A7_9ACTN|nr:LLM class flavin-dependent oxidoreductase [Nonomuraea endophytica]MBB5079461.1 alkanesulfonate monooxygenase SsuD/methylene tetrahydromethanopterin reductase-like flavin-dependent oxidoreductase (luciferase family) [Nonomuraea endophytica]